MEPAIALPDSVRVEYAVMRDLFAPFGATDAELLPPEHLDDLLADIEPSKSELLAKYGASMITKGRAWLGRQRAPLPKAFSYPLRQLRIKVQPHQTIVAGDSVTVRFFRARPTWDKSPQMQFLKWTAREVSQRAKSQSVTFELAILSTGELKVIAPYSDRVDHLKETADRLARGEFEARPSARNCARCRHFPYCPA
jgi:hypothetical protein